MWPVRAATIKLSSPFTVVSVAAISSALVDL
jgi:hypothetical protein